MSLFDDLAKLAAQGIQNLGESLDPNRFYQSGYQDAINGNQRRQVTLFRPSPSNGLSDTLYQVHLQNRDAYNRGYDDGLSARLRENR
jgi:ribosome modulation factor